MFLLSYAPVLHAVKSRIFTSAGSPCLRLNCVKNIAHKIMKFQKFFENIMKNTMQDFGNCWSMNKQDKKPNTEGVFTSETGFLTHQL